MQEKSMVGWTEKGGEPCFMTPKSIIIIIFFKIKEVFIIIKAALCTQGEGESLSVLREVEKLSRVPAQDSIGARGAAAAAGAARPAHGEESRESGTEKRGMCESRDTCAHVLYQARMAECQKVLSETVGLQYRDSLNLFRLKNASGSPANASKPGYPGQPLALVVRTQTARCCGPASGNPGPLASACQSVFGEFGLCHSLPV